MMADNWYVGNAAIDSKDHRGWIVGHFLDPTEDGVRAADAVEIKWGIHPAGEARHDWQADEQRTTVIILVHGRFRIELSTGTHVLKEEGDYAMWGPGIDHSWQAEEDSAVITVRWPSLSG
jgi:quercetin dioxygenase-like cupin family protein